jgi:hypothetical protein
VGDRRALPLAGQGFAVPRPDGFHHALLGRRGDRPQLAPGRDHAPGQTIRSSDAFWLAITPEGTRGYRPYWKSGFYRIAREAQLPLVFVKLDYGNKIIDVTESLVMTGDEAADMAAIARIFDGVQARHPKDAAPIRLAPPQSRNQAASASRHRPAAPIAAPSMRRRRAPSRRRPA